MSLSFGNFFEPTVAAQASAEQAAAARQNSARTAFSTHSFEVKGIGTTLLGTVEFDLVFLDRPRVMMGSSMLELPPLGEWGLPSINGTVTRWVVNKKGYYTGAQIYAVTDIRRVDGEAPEFYPAVSGVLDVVFIGTAYKELGSAVASVAELLTPRSTGLGG